MELGHLIVLWSVLGNLLVIVKSQQGSNSDQKTSQKVAGKSRLMCEKYGELLRTLRASSGTACLRKTSLWDNMGMFNGIKVAPEEFPHLALIGYKRSHNEKVHWQCTGSLVSENYVLTSASCVTQQNSSAMSVCLGDVDPVGTDITGRLEVDVLRTILPPGAEDVALLQLSRPVELSDAVMPVCLDAGSGAVDDRAGGVTTGLTNVFGNREKRVLKLWVNVSDSRRCRSFYGDLGLGTATFCGQGIVHPCLGSAGSPFQIMDSSPNCMYRLKGLVSRGAFRCSRGPTLYTTLAPHVPWIESVVWP